LAADGGKSVSGGCSLTDVSERTVQMMLDFQRAFNEGKFSYERQRQFSKDSEALGRLSGSNPGAACKEIERLRKDYNLHSDPR